MISRGDKENCIIVFGKSRLSFTLNIVQGGGGEGEPHISVSEPHFPHFYVNQLQVRENKEECGLYEKINKMLVGR